MTNSLAFGPSTLPTLVSDVTCAGSETNLLECGRKLHGTFECPTDSTAGVICSDGGSYCTGSLLILLCTALLFLACSDGDVRLVGGAVETEGTVEVCSKSLWGAIAAEEWTVVDATVVCKQLRYPSQGTIIDIRT